MALLLLSIMIIWHRGTQLEQKYSVRLKLGDYTENLAALRGDSALPELTQNLVYIGSSDDMETIDRNTLYSILDKDPKRARAYWFLSVHVLDEPNAMNYQVETFGTDYIFRVKLNLGFKNDQRVNIYLRQIVRDLLESGELPPQERKYSIYGPSQVGSFKFLMLRRAVPLMSELSRTDEIILNLNNAVRRAAGSAIQWYRTGHLVGHCGAGAAGHPPARTKTKSASSGEMNQKERCRGISPFYSSIRITPYTTLASVPNTMTGPATTNIFDAMPVMKPLVVSR